jgi:hypothetical protein
MKTITTSNGLTVMLDDADYEWAQYYEWHMKQKDGLISVVRHRDDNRRPVVLLREIALRLLGSEVVDKHTVVTTTSKNPLDCRRQYVSVRKYIRLPEYEVAAYVNKAAIPTITDCGLSDDPTE